MSRRSGTARSLAHAATGVSGRLDATGSGVRLRLAGEFALWRGGQFLASADIGSRKARVLLAFLAVQRRGPATVDRIAEVLWDAAPPKRPAANVATLVSRLRAVLGRDLIVGGRAGYRLSDAVGVDLHDAAKLVNVAEARLAGSPSSALASALAAVELLAGEVLADEPPSAWADPIRVWSLQLVRRARHVTAEAGLRTGDIRAAKAAAEAAMLADPLDETSYRHLMRVHQATDEPAQALQVYEQLRRVLASELGTLPALASRDLHAAILRAGNDRPDTHAAPVSTGDCGSMPALIADGCEHCRLTAIQSDPGAEVHLLRSLGELAASQLRFDHAIVHGRRAIAAARRAGSGPAMAAALGTHTSTYAYLGEIAEHTALRTGLRTLLKQVDDPWLTQWYVFGSAFPMIATGAWDAAAARITDALVVDQRSGSPRHESWYTAHLGWLARLAGRYEDALAHGRHAAVLQPQVPGCAAVPAMLAATLIETDQRAEAVSVLERSLADTGMQQTHTFRLRCLAPLAEATGSRSILDEADAMVRAISAPPGSAWLYGADAYVAVATAWLSHGEPGRARAILDPLLAAGARTGWTAPLAAAHRIARATRSPSHRGVVAPNRRTKEPPRREHCATWS